jgi:hypothetical protein
MFSLSNNALEVIVHLSSLVLPEGRCILDTLDKVRKVVHDLGHDYQKIDACVNDCVLFRKSYAKLSKCPTCGESRWKVTNDENATGNASTKKRSPRKILRYFLVISLLQRLYMMESTSSLMRWHKRDELVSDEKMCHLADCRAWKHVDSLYLKFAYDPRNVRLGLASDGFNPFGMLNVTYATWPVILIPYNLPPWLCLKQ